MNRINPILSTDSYKVSHFMQYPEGTQGVYSYISARKSSIPGCDEVVFFGLESYKRDRLSIQITMEMVEEAKIFFEAHGEPFNYEGWKYIVEHHNGYLPVKIRSVQEGTPVGIGNVMLTIENTDPACYWVTSYLETDILRHIWYGSTVATISRHCKSIIKKYLDLTADDPDTEINFKLHDFGFRGVSSYESAGIGGAAHLINFLGTDTVAGILHARDYYDAPAMPGFSIPAAEHSTMTAGGPDGEREAYQRMIDAYAKPGAIFAVVSDSYDIYNAVKNIWCDGLLTQVKEKGATVVIRPDSGDPTVVPVEIIELLMKYEGYTTNSKGFKVLPPHVRVIQGDGITFETIEIILQKLYEKRISASNIAFGMGGGLLQMVNRDTFGFAMKCSARLDADGVWHDVYKDPVTAGGSKTSLRGRLILIRDSATNKYATFREDQFDPKFDVLYNHLKVSYFHYQNQTHNYGIKFDKVRENAKL
jgi:nicotinamide phosphoribosyltransferase